MGRLLFLPNSMTLLDILLALPLCYLIFMGWKKGIVREITTLVGVLVGLWAATHLSQQVAPMLSIDGESSVLVAFIVIFLAALVLAYLLGRLVEGLMKAVKMGILNRLGGAVLGAVKALCILGVLLEFLVMVDSREVILSPQTKQKSILYTPVFHTGTKLTASLRNYIAEHSDEWKEVLQ